MIWGSKSVVRVVDDADRKDTPLFELYQIQGV
jgi:hypothetical protein